MNRTVIAGFFSIVAALMTPAQAAEQDDELARKGFAVLKTYCYGCHGVSFNGNTAFNVLVRDVLLAQENEYIVPGKPDDSTVWQRIANGEMPPEKSPQPSDEEKAILKQWIEAGLTFPPADEPERPFKPSKAVLVDILEHLRKTKQVDRPFQRYFTLTHVYNNKKNVSDFDYRLYQAAFSKAANSLSWEPDIVVPAPIDQESTVFNIDLRDIGWDEDDLWNEVLKVYPYGLKFDKVKDDELRELAKDVELLSGTPLAYIRADWFVFTASQPPLYHILLRIPETADELERELRVDRIDDFLRDKLARAAFAESGVSSQNRLVDRHSASYGAYWRSYDFAKNDTTSNVFEFPLGPRFNGNPFDKFAFVEAGGEIIFNLPNGLQGYMLVDGVGRRIDEGPINVVDDSLKTAGTAAVINGISCMACHKHGMIQFKDTVRSGLAVFGPALEKAHDLFPKQESMDRLISRDEDRFLEALDEATGVFLRASDEQKKDIREFAEPVSTIARFYYRDLRYEGAAFELGFEDPKLLQYAITTNSTLKRLGLGPLADGNSIKRELWESREFVVSPFQEAARELDVGSPLVFIGTK